MYRDKNAACFSYENDLEMLGCPGPIVVLGRLTSGRRLELFVI